MALIGTIAIAMKVTTRPFEAGLSKARSAITNFSSGASSAMGLVGGVLAGGAFLGAFGKAITAAANLTEETSKMQVIFGSASGGIVSDADKITVAYGMARREFYEASSSFGLLFKQMGKSGPELAGLSSRWTQLAVDISSFYNISTKDALIKLHAGLIGESEPMRQLGVFLTEDAVKAKAFAMGLAKTGEELTNGAKLQARAALIVGQLGDAMGDKARTALSPANQMRDVWGRIENLLAKVGDTVLPILGQALVGVNTMIEALSTAWGSNHQAIIEWAIGSQQGTIMASSGIINLISVVKTLADTWQVVRLAFTAVVTTIFAGLGFAVKLISTVVQGFDELIKRLTGASTGAGDFMAIWSAEMDKEAGAKIRNLEKDWEKPWSSAGIDASVQAAQQNMEGLRSQMAGGPGLVGSGLGDELQKKHKGEKPFGAATTLGSTEAASIVLRSRYGEKADSAERQLVDSNKRQETLLEQIAQATRQAAMGSAGGLAAQLAVI